MKRGFGALLAVAAIAAPLAADASMAGKAARSVHLSYPAPDGLAFYNEMTVLRSTSGSYFMACGWRHGYFGVQELEHGRKQAIFSVWDAKATDDPQAVPVKDRVQLLHQGAGVRVGRFGGEGTGGQSFFPFAWKPGERLRFLVRARPEGARTAFSGYLWLPARRTWKHLVTFSTLTGGAPLSGYYSFVEDFRRDGGSALETRQARYGNGWVADPGGAWHPLLQARFSADSNPALTIAAGLARDDFYLQTGGDTHLTGTALKDLLQRPAPGAEPTDLP